MSGTKRLMIAIAAAAFVLPAFAQKQAPLPSEPVAQEKAVKKTPEQVAKEKADKEKVRADAAKATKAGVKPEAEKVGQEAQAKKKTPEQVAKEKADKAKRGTTPEEQAKQAKQSPGN